MGIKLTGSIYMKTVGKGRSVTLSEAGDDGIRLHLEGGSSGIWDNMHYYQKHNLEFAIARFNKRSLELIDYAKTS